MRFILLALCALALQAESLPDRAHGNDERIRETTPREGAELLLKIVEAIALP